MKTKVITTIVIGSFMMLALLLVIGCGTCAVKEEAKDVVAPDTSKMTCPVSGDPVNPSCSMTHKGQKVYFSCDRCKQQFKEAPEKYEPNLRKCGQCLK